MPNSSASVSAVPVMPDELFVHAEIILQGDRREGLVFAFDLDALLGFDRLVKSVRPTPARIRRPVKSSTMITSPSCTTYWWSSL